MWSLGDLMRYHRTCRSHMVRFYIIIFPVWYLSDFLGMFFFYQNLQSWKNFLTSREKMGSWIQLCKKQIYDLSKMKSQWVDQLSIILFQTRRDLRLFPVFQTVAGGFRDVSFCSNYSWHLWKDTGFICFLSKHFWKLVINCFSATRKLWVDKFYSTMWFSSITSKRSFNQILIKEALTTNLKTFLLLE